MMEKRHFQSDRNFIGVTAAIVLGILLAFYGLILLWPQGNPYDTVKVNIPKGSSLKDVSATLLNRRIIQNERAFLLAVRTMGYEKDLPAGRFSLVGAYSNYEIIYQLVHSVPVQRRITILEGWTIKDVAAELEKKLGINQADFINVCSNRLLLWKWGVEGDTFEGYLYPETYHFSEDESPSDILKRLLEEYHANITEDMQERMEELGMTEWEVLTLASIIEGEAIYNRERPIISSVYHNRLNKGMRLQADPTIQYIIQDGPRRLLNKDLKIDSPYNTYLNYGLPPGPINNPGKESIIAAMYPADTNYLYFVARGNGYHAFSKTQSEHNHAKREFQKVRRKVRRQNVKKS